MKTAILIITILLIVIFVFQGYTTASTSRTESQPYTVIETDNGVEIREYPSVIMASYDMTAVGYKLTAGRGFRKLAGYIFGQNETDKKIAMTAPVQMAMTDTTTRMSFMMPQEYTLEDLPKPLDPSIEIGPSKKMVVAVISFTGYATDAKIARKKAELRTWLQANNVQYKEPFSFLGYNPPYQVLGRRNEVIVEIER